MQWHDLAMQEPRRSKLLAQGTEEKLGQGYFSDDKSMFVGMVPKDGEPDPDRWIVWDMTKGQVPAFGHVTFRSAGAAQRAGDSWKDSAVTWLALRVASACQVVSDAAYGVAATVAMRMAGE